MGHFCARMSALFALLVTCACADGRRPIYNVAHMVNSIGEIVPNLDQGANVLESDVQFYANGSVKEIFHGFPCDFGRFCDYRANLREYLQYLRNITDPSTAPKNYADKMAMQFFDLKLNDDIDTEEAGRNMARHVMDFLWSEEGKREQEVRALIYIDNVKYNGTLKAFMGEFKSRGQESRLKDVGYDGGSGNIGDIRKMFAELGVENVWIGDGSTNYISAIVPEKKLKEELKIRENPPSFIKKVYQWTIDYVPRMIGSLELGVDGFITNLPGVLAKLVRGPLFENTSRLATSADNPFVRYEG